MKKYDFVEVVQADEEIMDQFVGAKGMIIGFSEYDDYPVEVCLFDKDLQKIIVDEGNLCFKEEELEVIGRDE